MKKLQDVDLSTLTTIKLGGIASNYYIPESEMELMDLIEGIDEDYYIIGGGSNLLINDKKVFNKVISTKEINEHIEIDNCSVTVGASVSLQKFILTINKAGLGGIEFLFSVPGLIGGAVVMNAGRGRKYEQSISNYIQSVKVLRNNKIEILSKDNCNFRYRSSIFQNNNDIILEVNFLFPFIEPKITSSLRKERIALCKREQDLSKPNFGTVFSQTNGRIIFFMKKFRIGFKNGIHFSRKTNNWLSNGGRGTFFQAKLLINIVKLLNKLTFSKCQTEVHIWK